LTFFVNFLSILQLHKTSCHSHTLNRVLKFLCRELLEPSWLGWLLGDEVSDPVMWQHGRLGDLLRTNFNAGLALWQSNQPGHYLHKSVPIQQIAARVLARQYIIRDQEVLTCQKSAGIRFRFTGPRFSSRLLFYIWKQDFMKCSWCFFFVQMLNNDEPQLLQP